MERTIRVTGKGKLSVKPDTIRLIMTLEDITTEYADSLELSTRMTNEIKELFAGLGFDKKDVKTLHFQIEAEYERYQDRDNSWKRRFKGYKFTHRFKIEFPADNEKLGQVLYELSFAKVRPEFRIEYTVSDPEKQKNQLLKNAIADAKEKAAVLADASDVVLGDILTIDYSWGEINFVSRPMDDLMLSECCMAPPTEARGYDIDIEPDDIDVSDTVTVIWMIK